MIRKWLREFKLRFTKQRWMWLQPHELAKVRRSKGPFVRVTRMRVMDRTGAIRHEVRFRFGSADGFVHDQVHDALSYKQYRTILRQERRSVNDRDDKRKKLDPLRFIVIKAPDTRVFQHPQDSTLDVIHHGYGECYWSLVSWFKNGKVWHSETDISKDPTRLLRMAQYKGVGKYLIVNNRERNRIERTDEAILMYMLSNNLETFR